jgi:hypothetical protein
MARRRRDEMLDRFGYGGLEKRRARDLNCNLDESGDDPESDGIRRDPEQFKKNISYIVATYDIDLNRLSKDLKLEYRWLRRIVKDGLARRVGRLDRLAKHLGLPDGDYLWAADIKRFLPPPPPTTEQLGTLKQRLHWPYAERLLDLLEAGDHEYLKALIDRLHGACFSRPVIGPSCESGGVDPSIAGVNIQPPAAVGTEHPPAQSSPVAVERPIPGSSLARRIRSRRGSPEAT